MSTGWPLLWTRSFQRASAPEHDSETLSNKTGCIDRGHRGSHVLVNVGVAVSTSVKILQNWTFGELEMEWLHRFFHVRVDVGHPRN